MRRLLLATLVMSALTAGAQGFVTHRAKVAKQQSEISAKKAETRGQSVAPERQRGYFFVNCEQGADDSATYVRPDGKTPLGDHAPVSAKFRFLPR